MSRFEKAAPYNIWSPRWGSLQPGHPEVLVNLDGDGANITATVENMYANRAKLARDMLTLTQRWNFSGFTLDWVRFASDPELGLRRPISAAAGVSGRRAFESRPRLAQVERNNDDGCVAAARARQEAGAVLPVRLR